jgi:DNA-binding MarR family transcriptional regulator
VAASPRRAPKTPADACPLEAVRALARASRLLERATDELSLGHYRVLAAVAAGEERASRVASRLALGKPTVSATVESLCERGLVARARVAGDQRVSTLCLTAAGELLLERVEAEMVSRLAGLCERTPNAERVLESLVWLGAALDEARAERVQGGRL